MVEFRRRCGWCLTNDHLAHEDGVAPSSCACWVCTVSAEPLIAGQNTAWRYRCDACGFRRTGRTEEMDDIRIKHEEDCNMAEHMATLTAAWRHLDAQVQEIEQHAKVAGDAGGPPELVKAAARAQEKAQARARGGAEIMSIFIMASVETISKEAGDRAQQRAAGTEPTVLTPRELNTKWADR